MLWIAFATALASLFVAHGSGPQPGARRTGLQSHRQV
jgi:hypothetical protein